MLSIVFYSPVDVTDIMQQQIESRPVWKHNK